MTGAANDDGWLGLRTASLMVGRALRSRVLWLGLLLGLAATVGVLRVVRPIYRSEVVLFYRPAPGASFVSQTEVDPSRQLTARLKEMLFTRERLASLVKDFHLYPDQVRRTGLQDGVEAIKQHLKFESSGGDTFRISFEEESPQQAQAVAAQAAEMLLDVHRNWRRQDVVKAQQFFDAQKRGAEEVLREREAEFTEFLARHPEMALAMGTGTGPVTPGAPLRAASSESRLGSQDGLLSRLQARATRLRSGGSEPSRLDRHTAPEVTDEIIDSGLLTQREAARADFIAAERDLAEKQKQFTPEYPDVRQANDAVLAARERLRKVEDAIAAAKRGAVVPALVLQSEAEAAAPDPSARRRLSIIERQIVQARAKMLERDPKRLLELGTQLAELDRRASEARDRLAVIQSKQFQASLEATLDLQDKTGELVVIDPAFLPARAERRGRLRLGAMGAGAALALAFALSLGLVFFDDRLRAGFDLSRLRLPPLLAEVPRESHRDQPRPAPATAKLSRRTHND